MDWTSILTRVRAAARRWRRGLRVRRRAPLAPRAPADVVPDVYRTSDGNLAARAKPRLVVVRQVRGEDARDSA